MLQRIAAVMRVLSNPLDMAAIEAAKTGLNDLIVRQSLLKQGLGEIKKSMKQMIGSFIDELGHLAHATGDYHDNLENLAQQIRQTDDVDALDRLLGDVLRETRSVQASTNVTGVAITPTALTGTITINGVTTASISTVAVAATDGASVTAAINAISAATGVTASYAAATGVSLQAADGRNIVHSFTTLTAAATGMAAAATTAGTLTLSSTGTSGITAGGTVTIIGGPTTTPATKTGVAVSAMDLSTVAGSNAAIASLDAALDSVNSSRASLGAVQNRFSSVVASLQTTVENLTASRSRIQDTDFAVETAVMTRNQVMQQAGMAMLAQANALPNQVLALLRGN